MSSGKPPARRDGPRPAGGKSPAKREGDRGGFRAKDAGIAGGGGGRAIMGKEGAGMRKFSRRKFCRFSADKVEFIDYKNYRLLREMVTERGKIKPRGQTGTNARFQRMLSKAIKRARQMALLSPTKV